MRKFIMGGLMGTLGVLLFASISMASSSHKPKGEYTQFAECPLSRATITDCIYSLSSDGSFTVGRKTVPLKNPVILRGGFEGEGEGIKFYGAENGDTLSTSPQPVPGGLLGINAPSSWPKLIQDWFNGLINEGLTDVNATVELTGPTKGLTDIVLSTQNLIFGEKTALDLPVKIHLENRAILGSNCYIGSDSSPVHFDLSTGTSGSLKGSVGETVFNKPAETIITISGGKLVGNTFTAPKVSGCGGIFSFFVDPLINEVLGLPAGSGESAAILEGKFQDAQASAVKASE